jgi:hypothetical protein
VLSGQAVDRLVGTLGTSPALWTAGRYAAAAGATLAVHRRLSAPAPEAPVRPVLKPGLHTVWRDASTLQIGLDPQRAVVIGGVGRGEARLVAALDGSRDIGAVHSLARSLGVELPRAERLLDLLGAADALGDATTPDGHWAELDPAERDRLTPDATSLGLVGAGPRAGVRALGRRHGAAVLVEGAGRVGAAVAALVAAAGVGHVAVQDGGDVRGADVSPAGVAPTTVGTRRADAARALIRRSAPSTRTSLPRRSDRPDVVLLAPVGALPLDAAHEWMRADVPHLFAGIRETTGVVGPLVVPGRSSCLRCADLHRTDRDPAWPAVAAQLAGAPPLAACDVSLASLVAAQAALQVLTLIDGLDTPVALGATLETRLPGAMTRRRFWPPHPACGCGWPSSPPAGGSAVRKRADAQPETMAG